MAIGIGDIVPEFRLPTDGGGWLGNPDLLGKRVVVYFYPKDNTPGCTREAEAFRDSYDAFQAAGVQVVGVSNDSVASHDKFKSRYGLNFVLVSDPDAELAQKFGVWVEKSMYGKKYMGVERSTFLIDEAGVLRRAWRKVKVDGHADAVLCVVRAL